MTKTTTCFAIILVAGFAMLKLIDIQVDGRDSLPEIVAQDQQVQEPAVNYYTFKVAFDATLVSLRSGEMTLADAIEHVDGVATRYNSDYFRHLQHSETGASKDERIARNLVGHVACFEEVIPNPNSRLPLLEVELSRILQELARKR